MSKTSPTEGKNDDDHSKMAVNMDLEKSTTNVAHGEMEVVHQFGVRVESRILYFYEQQFVNTYRMWQAGVEMKKQFSGVAALGVAFSILNSWVGAAGSLLGPISLGGSVTVIWGCLAGAIYTTTLCMGVVEMASAMPGAGGPYHYTYVLAWEKHKNILVRASLSFIGIDATTHLSEEMPNPALGVPQAMLGALATGCVTSFAFLVALLFCVTNMDDIISTPTGVPVLAIFYQATNNKAVSVVLLSLILYCLVFTIISGILICGGTTWAFARDNGLPFSQYFGKVDEKTEMPLRATILSSCLCVVYGAIYVGSTVAFQSIVGSSIIMLFVTYGTRTSVTAQLNGSEQGPGELASTTI
ncbi:hypothetical protein ZTR_09182 [Talaromyces verruculosus]|nr:hypothetical protein ZTR_09182 [Talaromyces verruculosus]